MRISTPVRLGFRVLGIRGVLGLGIRGIMGIMGFGWGVKGA